MIKNCFFRYFFCLFFVFFKLSALFFADSDKNFREEKYQLNLTFSGDLMAHTENFTVKDFSVAYEDISVFLKYDDLSFCNFETPICNELPYSSYPQFNVHKAYGDAAINAGFDVFSVVNNHTNDQGKLGINSTFKYFTRKRSQEIYSAGIKDNESSSLSYDIIEKNGWRILFCAITEILNDYKNYERLDYYPLTKKSREKLKKDLINVQNAHDHDLFILSVHANEKEYELEVSQNRKKWYYELLNVGVDILWANHQHVVQEWELVKIKSNDDKIESKLIMYCLGNFLSGQRRNPNYYYPQGINEYKGDGLLLQVTISPNKEITRVWPIYITTHIQEKNNQRNFVVKHLSKSFIKDVENYSKKQANYYKKRLELMENIKEKTIWLEK